MADADHTSTAPDGATGFSRVLDAEKDADVRLEDGRKDGERIRQAGLIQERRIAARADRRVQALHGAIQANVESTKARMAAEFDAEKQERSVPPDADEIKAAAEALARQLIGVNRS